MLHSLLSPALCLSLLLQVAPAIAHTVEVAEDAAATLHIEPNDTPRAGESSQVWFTLTRKGGELIPLEQCDCALKIYQQPQSSSSPLLTPALSSINAEQYQGIPGAMVVFPRAGRYRLELSGRPRTEDGFKPFVLQYEITVAGGTASTNPSPIASPSASPRPTVTTVTAPASETGQTRASPLQPALIGSVVVLGMVGVWLGVQRLKRK
jgi:hypothetical protein